MTEQMHYATFGHSRRRRVNMETNKGYRQRHSRELRNEQYSVPSTCTDQRVRRKYTQTRRPKSPTPRTKTTNRSMSPTPRRPSIKTSAVKRSEKSVRSHLDRGSRLIKLRPRQLYQQKQKQFQRQIAGFDFFEKKASYNSIRDVTKSTSGSNKKQGAKLFGKSYFFISGNTCKKLMSRFRSDGSYISDQYDGENPGTVMSEEWSRSRSFYDEHSLVGGDSIVERNDVNAHERKEDASERGQELGSIGSRTERLSSLTFSQDLCKHKGSTRSIDDDSQDDHFDDELAILLDENKALRGSIHDLRKDFEVILKQIQMITCEYDEVDADQRSTQSDNSRISLCLRRIEELKLEALEKFKEVVENNQADRDEEIAKRERDIKSFEECIEDLLCENERLFSEVTTLTNEREDILKELKSLKQKHEHFVSSDASIATGGRTIPNYMLTDESEAESQHSDLDAIALLLKKMEISYTEQDVSTTEAEDDIISLVSKIMTKQRGHRETQHEVNLPVVPEEGEQEQEEATDDEDKVEAEESHCAESSESEESKSIKNADDDGYISGADDDDLASDSACSEWTYDLSDYSSEGPQAYEVSADSFLVHKKSPAFFLNHNDDDSSLSLEVIFEYYSSESGESDSSGSIHHESDSEFEPRQNYRPRGRFSSSTIEFSSESIESAEYYLDRSRSRSASTARSSSTSQARSRSTSRSTATSTSASRSRSAPRPNPSRHSSPKRRPSFNRESIQEEEDEKSTDMKTTDSEEQSQIANTINRHLDPILFKIPQCHTRSTCASISASDSGCSTPTYPSFSSDSTKEHKAITITVVCRSSRHISFPSTREHTYVSFFTASVRKKQIDAILEDLLASKTALAAKSASSLSSSNATLSQNNCTKKRKKSKKYKGEYNENGQRHGYGIYTSRNGNEYRGEWQNNEREGLGLVKIGNGDVFEGQFESNRKSGIGVYHYQDGECDVSRYRDDHRVGQSLRWSADRKRAFLLTEEDPAMLEISLTEAGNIALKMGIVVAH